MKKLLKKFLLASVAAGSFIFNPPLDNFNFVPTVQAEIMTYTGVGDCVQSELVTANQAKNYARLRAEINAKEQAGVYIRGYTKMQNFNLTENKIEVIASSILNIVGDVQYSVETMVWGNSPLIKHIASLQANIDTDELNAYIRREDSAELQSGNKQIKNYLDKIDNLNEQYNRATSQAEKDKIRAEFNEVAKNILAVQKLDEGFKYYEQGNYQATITLCNDVLKIEPGLEMIYQIMYGTRGTAYAQLKQYEAALADFNKAIELNRNAADVYNGRGWVYSNLGQYDKAVADFKKALELNPNYEYAYNNLAEVYFQLQQYDAAISYLNKSIEFEPDDAARYYNRGNAYQNLEQYDKAIADFSKAIKLNPNFADAYFNRALNYTFSNNLKQALNDITKAIEINPNDGEFYDLRGNIYKILGETEKANADFAKAKKLGYKD